MYQYSAIQWLLFFYLYCFLGWCVESVYVSVKDRHLVNRGFLKGPFLPLYGSGAVVMLIVSMPFRDNMVLTFLSGCIGATVLEYITGVAMEKLFNVRYWDYSRLKFNFQGQICLGTTLSWGALTVLLTAYLHKPVETFVLKYTDTQIRKAVIFLSVVIGIDFVISFRAAIDLKHLLIGMERAKKELYGIQKRLTELLEYAGNLKNGLTGGISSRTLDFTDSMSAKKEELSESFSLRLDELKQSIEEKFSRFTEFLHGLTGENTENLKEEFFEMRERYDQNVGAGKNRNSLKNALLRRMIRSNPDMTSGKFKESLEEIKLKFGYKRGGHTEKHQENAKSEEIKESDETDF